MNFYDVSLTGLIIFASAFASSDMQALPESNGVDEAVEEIVDEVVSGILQLSEQERIRDARMEVCRRAANNSGNFWSLYERAVAKDSTLGPPSEIANRCHFFIGGQLYQVQKRQDEILRQGN